MHAQDSCACTRILCVHKNLVHAKDSCACAAIIHKIDVFGQNTFFHKWGPDERWGAHWTVTIRVVAMHIFVIFIIPQQNNGFPARGRFMICRTFVELFDEELFVSKNDPEVSGSGRGTSPTY